MSAYTGVESRFRVDAKSFSDKEFLDYNVKYETKTVIDGHDSAALAGSAIAGVVVGLLAGNYKFRAIYQT